MAMRRKSNLLPNQLPLRVICATKKTREEFFSATPTGMSLRKVSDVTPVEVVLYTENSKGLSELYNVAIEKAANSPCILVFMHDDVEILDFFWGERVRHGLNNFDILGLAGNSNRKPFQPSWFFSGFDGEKLIKDDYKNFSGSVGHYDSSTGKSHISVYGNIGKSCELMDGLFFAVESTKLMDTNTKFDPMFRFHFYDMDFCRAAQKNGLTMGTIGLSVIHHSTGRYDAVWRALFDRYIEKWKN